MIYNTTSQDPDVKDEIIRTLGPPYGFREIFRMGSVGSSRMRIAQYSSQFKKMIEHSSDFAVASIGLRPKGILVSLSKNDRRMCWTIPYYRLSIYKTELLSIHAEGQFLKLELQGKQNHKFIQKILEHKIKFEQNFTA